MGPHRAPRAVRLLGIPSRLVSVGVRSCLALIAGYLGVITVAASLAATRRRTHLRPGAPSHRFAILVPAHNEEQVIGDTLEAFRQLDYPAESMAVHVVVDNCTDRTAQIVRAHGFEVHERDHPDDSGKGPALQWLMARLREREEVPDAVVVVDADTVVAPGFLEAANRRLASGAEVVQGHYAVRDPGDSPLVAFRAAAMAARTYLRPLGRDAIGGSAGLHGNGMVFRSEVFGRHRWTHHLTEDVEQHLQLLLDGTLVRFAPDAVVEAEMPTTLAASRTQHERWEGGRFDLARRYVPKLLRTALVGGKAPRRAYLDAALDQFVPPLSIALVASAGLGAIGTTRVLRGRRGGTLDLAVAGTSLAVLVAHVLTALRLVKAPPSQYRALLMTPRLVVWKLGLWARVVARPSTAQWTRTARNVPAGSPPD